MTRAGASVPEVLTTLLLGAFLLQVCWSVLDAQRRVTRRLLAGSDAAEAGRIITGVLRRELWAGVAGADWTAPDGDSLSVRSFRGTGLPCGPASPPGDVPVVRRGGLVPVPGRDSVAALLPTGRWSVHGLADRGSAEEVCSEEGAERWTLKPAPAAPPVLLRLFRRGSYHLAGGTLRYRRGLGGRQPLAPEVLDDRRSGLTPGPDGGVRLRLRFRRLPQTPGLNPHALTIWGPDG